MLLSVKQVADRLGVCKKTVFRRIADGSLTAIRLGNKTLRIEEVELQRYIESCRTA